MKVSIDKDIKFMPQPGPQMDFIRSTSSIAIFGGAAFGGKTRALLLEPLHHYKNPRFKAVIFRRTYPQIIVEGGLLDEAANIYPFYGGTLVGKKYSFESGATIRFAHLQHDKDRFNWQGSQVPFFAFDELTHFTKKQFEYLIFSRGRSNCGIIPYVRATCNPDPDSFVATLIDWWIDEKTGLPIPERSGQVRWFVRDGNEYIWATERKQLQQQYPNLGPKSLTFIAAKVTDNAIGMRQNPGYIANLQALPLVDRERLLNGNWKIRESAGMFFQRSYFRVVEVAPVNSQRVRYWDRAATVPSASNKNPDWTAGVLLSRSDSGTYYIEHVERLQGTPATVELAVKTIAGQDSEWVTIGIEQDPGSAGKSEGHYYVTQLAGYDVRLKTVSKNKMTRAKPVSAQAEAGNICVVRGSWNDAFLNELENFPDGSHDDQVDALSGAFAMINEHENIFVG